MIEILDRVIVTIPFINLFMMQVCTVEDATDAEILAVANRDNPSGTSLGWSKVIREDSKRFEGPVHCQEYPERIHYLVIC